MVKNPLTMMQFKKDCRIVFASPEGKRVLSYIMKHGCVTTPVASVDQTESLRNEGMQRLALSIVKAAKQSPTELEQHIEDTLYET